MGFEQKQNSRTYRFDVREKDKPSRKLAVTADMDLFRIHRVAIQEGPALSGSKLGADLESGWEGAHQLTEADVRAYLHSKSIAEELSKTRRGRGVTAEDSST
jgi:hypothetical protein